jgi:hypothetical protein
MLILASYSSLCICCGQTDKAVNRIIAMHCQSSERTRPGQRHPFPGQTSRLPSAPETGVFVPTLSDNHSRNALKLLNFPLCPFVRMVAREAPNGGFERITHSPALKIFSLMT